MKTMHYDTLSRVKAALAKSGYTFDPDDDILSAKFLGWNDQDHECHAITFFADESPADEGAKSILTGCVYIDKDGKGEF